MQKTFYFDTGVRPYNFNPPVKPYGRQIIRGTIQIPFICEDVPDNAFFKFACDNGELPEAKHSNILVRKILDAGD
jgi:hypothetical protein